jgi:hypothetical protein
VANSISATAETVAGILAAMPRRRLSPEAPFAVIGAPARTAG